MERVKKLLKQDRPVKWLFYGDSITHGAFHTFGCRDYTELFAERVRYEMGRKSDIVINTGISGNTTRQLLDGFDWRVRQFAPHIVFVMIGMNDGKPGNGLSEKEFEDNLDNLCMKINDINGLPVLQTTCPILRGSNPEMEDKLQRLMEIARKVADGKSLPIIDHTRFWRQNEDQHFYWMSNPNHPNEYGHRAFAYLIFKDLGIYESNAPTCRLFYPI